MTDVSDAAGSSEPAGAHRSASAVAMALAVMALGGFVVFDSVTGLADPGYAQVGPGVFPLIVGAALLLAGLGLLVQGIRGHWRVVWADRDPSSAHSRESGNPETSPAALGPRLRGDERASVALIAAALTLNVLLFTPLGFVVASAVLFICVSSAFGSRRFILDAVIGIASAAAIHFIFVHGLGLSLPVGGLWEGVLWRR
jgi:putative tricarboxylic transport membrane protein